MKYNLTIMTEDGEATTTVYNDIKETIYEYVYYLEEKEEQFEEGDLGWRYKAVIDFLFDDNKTKTSLSYWNGEEDIGYRCNID